jgi:uncharacterized OB-fold protein
VVTGPKLHDPALYTEAGDGLALIGQRCRDCGKIAFPRKRVCPECFGEHLGGQVLSRTGVLHTFTRTHTGVPHLAKPYVIGLVDVPEGIRLLTLIEDYEPYEEVLRAGLKMEMIIAPLMTDENGTVLHSYKFRPAQDQRPQ